MLLVVLSSYRGSHRVTTYKLNVYRSLEGTCYIPILYFFSLWTCVSLGLGGGSLGGGGRHLLDTSRYFCNAPLEQYHIIKLTTRLNLPLLSYYSLMRHHGQFSWEWFPRPEKHNEISSTPRITAEDNFGLQSLIAYLFMNTIKRSITCDWIYINNSLHLVWKYLVNKPLLTTCLLADCVYIWEIVQKKNMWPRSEAFRANVNTDYLCILITVSTNYFIDYKNISSGTLYKHVPWG